MIAEMTRPRVALADDHAMLLEAFQHLLESSCEVVGTATNGADMLALVRAQRPEVVVLDISMPGMNGIETFRQLRRESPDTRVVFLTVNEDPEVAAQTLREGASGYVVKTAAARELFDAIRVAMSGGMFVTRSIADAVHAALQRPASRGDASGLSPRQREILALVAAGFTMREIAEKLSITPRTVAFHKYRTMEVLDLKTTAELIQYAVRNNIVAR
ncbi:MAG: hypothetical protein RL148_1563 [Planctomycetota bacterium]|jgi:DNA-binding NarL/FixJ family response regulator